jgi:hypothetical protein
MRLVCITDLHGRLSALERILADAGPADAVLLGGDLTTFGSPSDAERIVAAAQRHAATVLAVAGNCDSAAIDERLGKMGVGLHGRGIVCGVPKKGTVPLRTQVSDAANTFDRGTVPFFGLGIHGLSAIAPWKRGMYQLTEEELAAALQTGYAAIQGARQHVLLAHVPPHGLRADRTFFWKHAGSTAVREFVERTQPALVLCGHIHEGRGIESLGHTTVANCGYAGHGDYAVAELDGDTLEVTLHSAG